MIAVLRIDKDFPIDTQCFPASHINVLPKIYETYRHVYHILSFCSSDANFQDSFNSHVFIQWQIEAKPSG